jgi:opacity protein-like surface antigen
MIDRPHLEIDGLGAAEGAFGGRELFVGGDRRGLIEHRFCEVLGMDIWPSEAERSGLRSCASSPDAACLGGKARHLGCPSYNYSDNWAFAGFPLFSGTGEQTRAGWTVGTGVEWGLWNNWSVKVEYDYLDFGKSNVATTMFGIQNSNHINEVKAGLNWRILPNLW